MKETLLAYAFLLCSEFIVDSEYRKYIDDLFMKNTDDDLLLELEWHIYDLQK